MDVKSDTDLNDYRRTSAATHCLERGVVTYPCPSTFEMRVAAKIRRAEMLLHWSNILF